MKSDTKIQIVAMGDSNTEGFGLDSKEQSYPYKLNILLGSNVLVHNKGVSGSCVINTTMDGRILGLPYVSTKKYKEALDIDGQIFTINLGTNDAQDGMDDVLPVQDKYNNLIEHHEKFIKDYTRIIDDVIANHPKAQIVVCIPIPVRKCIWRKHQQKYMDMLVPYYKEILKRYDGIECIDLLEAFMQLEDSEIDSMYLDDGLHLNDKGTTFVASYMEPIIRKLL